MTRPTRLVAVVGTGTDVGKTWVTARLLETLRTDGNTVAARKPAQSFDVSDDPACLDAAVLGAASAESPTVVCPPHRWYEAALAPPMAAQVLGRPVFTVADLVAELQWPDERVDVGFVETAGGIRSPIADDGDCRALVEKTAPDKVVLVADSRLGTINAIRLTSDALLQIAAPVAVVLNRFDEGSELHHRNLAWLRDRDHAAVFKSPGDEKAIAEVLRPPT